MKQKYNNEITHPKKKNTSVAKNSHPQTNLFGVPKDSPAFVIRWAKENNAEKRYQISRINGQYYVYAHPGHTYLGALKEDGIHVKKSEAQHVSQQLDIHISDAPIAIDSAIQVDEYGFSYAVLEMCPERWKAIIGPQWKIHLIEIIRSLSPNSYLRHLSYAAIPKSYCARALYEHYTKLSLRELYQLMGNIHVIRQADQIAVTALNDKQAAFCREHSLALNLNVDLHAEVVL